MFPTSNIPSSLPKGDYVPAKKRVKFECEEASNSLENRVSLLHRQQVEILATQEIILSKLEEISKTIETQNRLPPPPLDR